MSCTFGIEPAGRRSRQLHHTANISSLSPARSQAVAVRTPELPAFLATLAHAAISRLRVRFPLAQPCARVQRLFAEGNRANPEPAAGACRGRVVPNTGLKH